nr:hypothetical protein [Methylobacterium frigidaeris]
MTPPIDHNRIASTLERLLNDTLERHDPNREAVPAPDRTHGLAARAGRVGPATAHRPWHHAGPAGFRPALPGWIALSRHASAAARTIVRLSSRPR